MSFQSTLGEGESVAEELAAGQRSISIAEFFEKNKHMLGFDSGARGLVTAVKEAVDNALDACEEAGVLPDIYVEIEEAGDYYRLVVEDNGPGITKEQLPKVFGKLLYGSRFHAREQSRGQQGIGISAAVLYSQLTSGKPAKITSRTRGAADADYFELVIDTDTNEPEIDVDDTTSWDRPHGTRIELEMEANMRARSQLHDYIEHTAVVNPHARLELVEPEGHFKYERGTDELPAETEEIRPHPHGVELGALIKMLDDTDSYSLSGFLQEEFTRVGGKTAENVLDNFRDRYYGREMGWAPPEGDVEDAVSAAVANKSSEATDAFAAAVAGALSAPATYTDVVAAVEDAAEEIEADHRETFGSTVRENAVEAAWGVVSAERAPDCERLVDDATTTRKDERAVAGLAERIAETVPDLGERHRFTRDALSELVARAADRTEDALGESFGETARENVVEAFWSAMATVSEEPPKVSAVAGDRDAAAEFLRAMEETDIIAPPTDCLSPITPENVHAGLEKEFDADFYAAATRDADVHGGDPFIVEAGIAYGGELESEGNVQLMRFANRVPLVYQRGACATADVVGNIGWRNYGLDQPGGSGTPKGPCVVMVHVASTNVPFTSESKDAIANVPEIEDEIELAIREAARELKSYLNKRRSMQKRRQKQDVLATILPRMAEKVAEVVEREEPEVGDAMARIMNNVLVERDVEDGSVSLTVENNSDTAEELEITDIVSSDAEPEDLPEDVRAVEMDGEYFLTWHVEVPAGEAETLEYRSDADGFDLSVEGVEDAKLTISQ
jgi:DNA topoisomerase-6 subunit B